MVATSAGLLLWRRRGEELHVLIVHPGGPFWANKDAGAWSLPKGEFDAATEDGLDAAKREFGEELGSPAPDGDYAHLGSSRMKSGKVIHAWSIEGDLDTDAIVSNEFEIEWPPRSGTRQRFPEVDRAAWVDLATAAIKLNPANVVFLDRLTSEHGA